jgi:hypothetical protein
LTREIDNCEGHDIGAEIKDQFTLISIGVTEIFIPRVPGVEAGADKMQDFAYWKEPTNVPACEVSQERPQNRRSKRWKGGAGKNREGEDPMSKASDNGRQYPEDEANSRTDPSRFNRFS